MAGVGVVETFIIFGVFAIFGLVPLVLWIIALIDALKVPDQTWETAGQNKLLWVLVIVLLTLLGAILYWFIARPSLKQVQGNSAA